MWPSESDTLKNAESSFNTIWPHLNLWAEVKPNKQHTVNKSTAPAISERKYKMEWTDSNVSLAFLGFESYEKGSQPSIKTWFYWRCQDHRSACQTKQRQSWALRVRSTPDKSQWAFLQFMGSSACGWRSRHGRNTAWMTAPVKEHRCQDKLRWAECQQPGPLPQTHSLKYWGTMC